VEEELEAADLLAQLETTEVDLQVDLVVMELQVR
jgi:hypothetical protein